ncbi:MAG: transposase [Candidatus Rokubacteria bacterium]|nr:transposase [Candidatus Rokubacteria bacterium]
MREQSIIEVGESRPGWEALEASAREGIRRLLQQQLAEEVEDVLGRQRGRWIDNVFVERLWRSVKYESIYLHAYEIPREVTVALARYFEFYNAHRSHQSLLVTAPHFLQ